MAISQNDIRYFLETCKTQNISQAAANLNISQPSVSQAIQKLEHDIGAPLFIRSKNGVKLTQSGKSFFTKSAELMQLWDSIKEDAHAYKTEITGRYDLGAHSSMTLNILTEALANLMQQHAKLQINLKHKRSKDIVDDILNLKLDMGLAVNPMNHPELIIKPLLKGEVTFWKAANLQNDTQNHETDFGTVIFDPQIMRSASLLKEYEERGRSFSRSITSSDLEVIADLAGRGLGIAILPENVARRSKHNLIRCNNGPAYYDDHCLVYRKNDQENLFIKTSYTTLKNASYKTNATSV